MITTEQLRPVVRENMKNDGTLPVIFAGSVPRFLGYVKYDEYRHKNVDSILMENHLSAEKISTAMIDDMRFMLAHR